MGNTRPFHFGLTPRCMQSFTVIRKGHVSSRHRVRVSRGWPRSSPPDSLRGATLPTCLLARTILWACKDSYCSVDMEKQEEQSFDRFKRFALSQSACDLRMIGSPPSDDHNLNLLIYTPLRQDYRLGADLRAGMNALHATLPRILCRSYIPARTNTCPFCTHHYAI